jgi:cysteine-rich repeat protein
MHATSNGCAFTYCLWLKASSPPAVLSLTSNGGASMCAGDYCVYKQYPSPGSCQSSSSNYNTSSNSSSASSQGVCGNGQLEGAEECDDGNTKNGDGCDAACHVENGYVCTVQSSGADTCMTVCGDGIVAGSEGCDDGPNNGKSGDACSAVCTVNQGFVCSFNGSSQGLNSAIWQMATSVSSSSFGHVFRQTCDPTVVNGISCGCPGEPTCGSVNSSASPLSMAPASQRFAVFLRLPALAS